MIKKISLVILLVVAILCSCEKDDICPEATSTTPHLIIRFYDINNDETLKSVRRLSVNGIDDQGNLLNDIVFNTSTDSIVVPLRFQEENVQTTTRFALKKDTDFDLDSNDTTVSNTDIIEVTYSPKFIYVSRACGYKSIFELESIIREPEVNNWIINQTIIIPIIENENEAHINIYH
jgi:hypothetical protein